MIGIDPHTGATISGLSQLIMRIDRMIRTVKSTRPKHRTYGTISREHLGKMNTRVIITKIQNELLTEINDPINGLFDFDCEQVKLMPDGKLFFIGKYNGERTSFSV